jgi:phosphate transport system substrate-binding protein
MSPSGRVHLGFLTFAPKPESSFHPTVNTDWSNRVMISKRLVATAAIAALVLAACGDDDDSTAATTAAPAPTEAPATTAPGATTMAPATTEGSAATTMAPGTTAPAESSADLSSLSGEIFVTGSSTVEPISIAVGDAFADMAPGVAVTVEGPGTGDGFAKFCAGEADIADASRAIHEDEAATCEAAGINFIELKVGIDGLSVITSAQDTEIECLSFVDLYALLGPDAVGINNWSDASANADEYAATVTDLGAVHTPYPDAELTITAPGEESGTFDSFVELVIAKVGTELGVDDANVRVDYTASPNDNVIIEGVASNPTSLGWVGFAYVEENLDKVKPLEVDGGGGCVAPSPETIASGDYPIARDLYIYVDAAKAESNPALAAFVDYYVNDAIGSILGTGDGQVPYVPLAAEDQAATQATWAARTTGTQQG